MVAGFPGAGRKECGLGGTLSRGQCIASHLSSQPSQMKLGFVLILLVPLKKGNRAGMWLSDKRLPSTLRPSVHPQHGKKEKRHPNSNLSLFKGVFSKTLPSGCLKLRMEQTLPVLCFCLPDLTKAKYGINSHTTRVHN
jgi:hypothetical protein